MDSNPQFRLATQIHLGLLRHLGTGIEVPAMLEDKSYAREVVYVCLGCADPELNRLGQEFVELRNAEREARSSRIGKKTVPASVPTLPAALKGKQPAAAAETPESTSFELSSQFIQDDSSGAPPDEAPRKRWFDPARWLRRGTAG